MTRKLSPYIKDSFNAASPHLEQAYNAALPHLSSVFTPGLFQRGKVQNNNDTIRPANADKGIVESSLVDNSSVEKPVPKKPNQPNFKPDKQLNFDMLDNRKPTVQPVQKTIQQKM